MSNMPSAVTPATAGRPRSGQVRVVVASATGAATIGVRQREFGVFLGAFLVVFLLSGMDNGSTYRMIPVIFGALGRLRSTVDGLGPSAVVADFRSRAAAVIGIVGAIGAFGGYAVQQVFRVAAEGANTAPDGRTGEAVGPVARVPRAPVAAGTRCVRGVLRGLRGAHVVGLPAQNPPRRHGPQPGARERVR